jgi:signal transduction histidine kinase
MQIKTRITIQFIVVVTVLFAIVFSIIYYSSANYRKREFYERLSNKALTTVSLFASLAEVDSTMLRLIDRAQKDKLRFENTSIFNEHGRIVYQSTDTIPPFYTAERIKEVKEQGDAEFTVADFEIVGRYYEAGPTWFVVFSSAYDLFGFSKLANLRRTLLILLLFLITVLAIMGSIYSGRALKPLLNLVHEVEGVDVRKFNTRLKSENSNDEIGRLVISFNNLLDRIQNAFQLQKIFVSGASHELKNPLTAITSQLQVVLLKDRQNEEYKKLLQSILEDIQNLNRTTIDLMEFARLNYEEEVNTTAVRIDDIIWQSTEEILKNNKNYKINVNFRNMPEDANRLLVKGNQALLKIAFTNIIDNACKFSADHTCIIELNYTDNSNVVTLTDHGIGLTPQEAALIFEPFYRANSTAERKGHGIGLALTKKIFQLHQVDVSVKSEEGKGTEFTVQMPRDTGS